MLAFLLVLVLGVVVVGVDVGILVLVFYVFWCFRCADVDAVFVCFGAAVYELSLCGHERQYSIQYNPRCCAVACNDALIRVVQATLFVSKRYRSLKNNTEQYFGNPCIGTPSIPGHSQYTYWAIPSVLGLSRRIYWVYTRYQYTD